MFDEKIFLTDINKHVLMRVCFVILTFLFNKNFKAFLWGVAISLVNKRYLKSFIKSMYLLIVTHLRVRGKYSSSF